MDIKNIEVLNQGYRVNYKDKVIDAEEYRGNTVIYAPREITVRRDMTKYLADVIKERYAPFSFISRIVKVYAIGVGYQNRPTLESLDRYSFVRDEKTLVIMKSELADTYVSESNVKIINKENKKSYKIKLPHISPHTPMDVQRKYIKSTLDLYRKGKSRVLIMEQPGGGKTFMSTIILSKINERYLVLVKGRYVDKWVEDVKEYHGIEPFVIKGKASFKKLIKLKETGEIPDIYILSTNTLDSFNRQYLKGVNYLEGYLDDRSDLLKFLEVNIILSDEAHEFFSSTIEGVLQLDPKFLLSLSGTFSSSRKYREFAMAQFYDESSRLMYGMYTRYIQHFSYKLTLTTSKNTLERLVEAALSRGRGFSQNALEQTMINWRGLKETQLANIKFIIDKHLYGNPIYRPGHKLVLYVASIRYAEYLATELSKVYNGVTKYTGNDDYDNILNGEIVVTNVAKAGTAIDIKKLLVVLLIDIVGNKEGLIQLSSRLRKEYFEGETEPYSKTFISYYINGIDKHARNKYLVDRVLKHRFTKQTNITDSVQLPFKDI